MREKIEARRRWAPGHTAVMLVLSGTAAGVLGGAQALAAGSGPGRAPAENKTPASTAAPAAGPLGSAQAQAPAQDPGLGPGPAAGAQGAARAQDYGSGPGAATGAQGATQAQVAESGSSRAPAANQTPAPTATPAVGASQPPRQRWEHTVRQIDSGKWTGPRLPDGQPDIQGDWSNTIGNHNNFTDPQGVIPNDPSTRNRKLGPRAERAPSRISDPADGEIPFQPWARVYQQDFLAHLLDPIKPEYIEPFARCAPGGIPKSFIWHGYEIRQFPGYVLFLFDSGTRIVHLDDKPPLPDNIKLWNGDSRGQWEGNTLVVDVRNNNSKARFARTGEFASENVKIQERYIFDNDRKHYNYVATFTDPTVFTRSFTTTIPARRYTVDDTPDDWHYQVALAHVNGQEKIPDHFERTCVENNGGFGRVALPSSAAGAAPAAGAVAAGGIVPTAGAGPAGK